jgi:stress response protein YsnF
MSEYPPASGTTRSVSDNVNQEETVIPVTEERLGVSKSQSTIEVAITKTPITETKTVEVPVTHEEISVERRPASQATSTATDTPVESEQEIRFPLKQEQVQVTKEPYVKEK